MAVALPSANSTVAGAVPSIMFPESVTPTFTVRAPAVSVRVSVNSAAVPSSTGEATSAIVTVPTPGITGSSSSVTVTMAESGVPGV